MILDTSVIVAIMIREPHARALLDSIDSAPSRGIGTATLAETGLVLTARLRRDVRDLLARFLLDLDVMEVPFTTAHWQVAVEAFRRFGKGRHPAALNFGDCLSYATARVAGRPLLFVGGDFEQTDIESA